MAVLDYDVVVIGAGPGGYPAAVRLAQAGKRVALIEKNLVGGTCVNRGCISTKALLSHASVLHTIRRAKDFGIEIPDSSIGFKYSSMIKKKDDVVAKLRKNVENLMLENQIDILRGRGYVHSSSEVHVDCADGKKIIRTKDIILATGSEPKEVRVFPFDGTHIHSSTTLLDCQTLPKSIAIIGGGVIGCEFASFLSELGTKVTIVEALDRIIPLESPKLSQALTKNFQKRGIEIVTGHFVQSIEKFQSKIEVTFKEREKIEAECALVAVGRSLNTQDLGLEKVGVKLDNGAIVVDQHMQTTVPHIWAIGDITAKAMYAHVATHQGLVAADTILGRKAHMNYDAVPGVIFTDPEIGSVGMTLEIAKAKGYTAKLIAYPFQALGKAHASQDTEGFAQIVIDEKTGAILGAQVIGHEASNLIGQMAQAIANELTIESITETIHAHPTLSEAWLETALIAQGLPLHFPPIATRKNK